MINSNSKFLHTGQTTILWLFIINTDKAVLFPRHGKISGFFSWRHHSLGRGVLLVSSLEAESGVACQRPVGSGAFKMQDVEC